MKLWCCNIGIESMAQKNRIMKSSIPFSILLLVFLTGCIGDDILEDRVDPVIRIQNPIDTLAYDSTYQFTYSFLNNVGMEVTPDTVEWHSSNPEAIFLDANGWARADSQGSSIVTVRTFFEGREVGMSIDVTVGAQTTVAPMVRTGTIQTTSSYALGGSFTITEQGDDLLLEIAGDYTASTALPGLYLYLSNNPNSTSDALEVGAVTTFSGAHNYTILSTGISDYNYLLYFCKPFNVKVGDGRIN